MNIITEEQKRQHEEFIPSNRPKNLIASLVSSIEDESSSTKAFLTPEEVFDEVSLSTFAGFETTSTALSWFIFYMSKHPHVQQKIKDELRANYLFSDTPLTQDLLDSLIYVECVVKELLRFAPIASQLAREATRDDIIDGISIKKGDIITIAIQNLHRDPRYWKVDPTQFIPERFLNEDKNPPQYAYIPFGGGHRACAGQDLAFFELKVAITRLMQRVTFEDPGDEANNTGGFIQRITCFPKHLAVRVRINADRESD
jgi:cytochrome P450